LESFDRINLTAIMETLNGLGLGDYFSMALRHKLREILGPAIDPPAKPPGNGPNVQPAALAAGAI
jgi:hypothetical protein